MNTILLVAQFLILTYVCIAVCFFIEQYFFAKTTLTLSKCDSYMFKVGDLINFDGLSGKVVSIDDNVLKLTLTFGSAYYNAILWPISVSKSEKLTIVTKKMDELNSHQNIINEIYDPPKTIIPYIQKKLLETKYIQCRVYQEPGRCTISLGVRWDGPILFHLHILIWEIDLEFGS